MILTCSACMAIGFMFGVMSDNDFVARMLAQMYMLLLGVMSGGWTNRETQAEAL